MIEEKKTNQNLSTIKGLMVIVGILALFASYVLVFSKYKTINEDLETEIDGLETRCEDLENKYRNKEAVEEKIAENEFYTQVCLAEFDGGLSYQAEIVDLQNFINKMNEPLTEDIKIPSLSISEPADFYTFSNGLAAKAITYNYSVTGTYAQMKDTLRYFEEYKGKRKVPLNLSFKYDYAAEKVTLELEVTEYAIVGEGREQQEVVIPSYEQGNLNVFYNEDIRLG